MKKICLLTAVLLGAAVSAVCQSKPTRDVTLPTDRGLAPAIVDYQDMDRGFFATGEVSGAVTVEPHRSAIGFTELDAIGGYRFSEFLRAGIGIGARSYFSHPDHTWALPLFVDLRGNFIPTRYRDVVPFWSFDIGTTFPDGFMFRPTVGIRVGQQRSAFTASFGYLGQTLRTGREPESRNALRRYYSFLTLKLGYEF